MKQKFKEIANKIRTDLGSYGFCCEVCGKEIFDYPAKRICEKCASLLPYSGEKVCPICGRPIVSEGICLDCKAIPPLFARGMSVFKYEKEAAKLVNRFKNGDRYLSFFFSEELFKKLPTVYPLNKKDAMITAVPLSEKAYAERGYNQSEELAKRLSSLSGIPYRELLLKVRDLGKQKNSTARERFENSIGAYKVFDKESCREKTVILIDDIMTTGATGSACAGELNRAGAKEVIFLSVAAESEVKQKLLEEIK